jgi:hypothetical protein
MFLKRAGAYLVRIVRITGTTFILLLAIIGGITVVIWFVPKNPPTPRAPDGIRFSPSPDAKFKAALLTFAGGGALSPYCYEKVSIVPAAATDHDAAEDRFEVYSGPCDSFSSTNNIIEQSPKLEWLSDTELRITISINSTAMGLRAVRLKKQDASRKVRVAFLAHD